MSRAWRQFADRVDGMSVRERAMILLAISAMTYSIFDTTLLAPLLGRQRYIAQELAQRHTDVRTLREKLQALAQGRAHDPDAANRTKLKEVNEHLAAVERELQEQSRVLIAPERMRSVVERVLASRPGLQLVELKTLPQSTLDLSPAVAPKPAAAPTPAGGTQAAAGQTKAAEISSRAQLFKHGFEVTLRGSYLELLDYVRGLEQLPDRLYWDKLQLSVGEHPVVTMKLTIYTVSMDKGWLQV